GNDDCEGSAEAGVECCCVPPQPLTLPVSRRPGEGRDPATFTHIARAHGKSLGSGVRRNDDYEVMGASAFSVAASRRPSNPPHVPSSQRTPGPGDVRTHRASTWKVTVFRVRRTLCFKLICKGHLTPRVPPTTMSSIPYMKSQPP